MGWSPVSRSMMARRVCAKPVPPEITRPCPSGPLWARAAESACNIASSGGAPERVMMQAAIDKASERVTGRVRLKLYKGNVMVTGRQSPNSLYDQDMVTFEAGGVYDQRDAEGFIKLNALRLRLAGKNKG